MKLTARFNRLTLWNKIGVVGSLCSIVALLLWAFTNDKGGTANSSSDSEASAAASANPSQTTEVNIAIEQGEHAQSESRDYKKGDQPTITSAGVPDEPQPFDVTLADGAVVRVAPHLTYSLEDKVEFLVSVGGHHKVGHSLDLLTQKVSIRMLEQVSYVELRKNRAELEESARREISEATALNDYVITTFTFGPLPKVTENKNANKTEQDNR
ncbi:MAG: hypothetical protein WA771_13195 [Chthoniobacterales bacterium]